MSTKKKDSSSSTVKRKASAAGKGSAHSIKKKSHTAGARPTTVARSKKTKPHWEKRKRSFKDIHGMIKEADTWTELALCMKYIRDAAALVDCFNFPDDARFHHECLSGRFKDVRKIALDRFSAASKLGANLVDPRHEARARKAYSAALHKLLLTKKIKKSERELVMRHLAHYINPSKMLKTPFGTEALPVEGDSPFGEGELRTVQASDRMGKLPPKKKRI